MGVYYWIDIGLILDRHPHTKYQKRPHISFHASAVHTMSSQLKFWRKGEAHRTTITRHNHETHSLLGADPSELHLVKSAHDDVRPSSSCPSMACNIIAVLLCITCVALNWLISITYSTCRSSPDFRSVSREQYHALRRPSPFLGFDSIPRASPPIPRMLINYPMAIALVNSSRPEQVFSDDPQQHMTETGTVSPEVRPVVLTNEVSSSDYISWLHLQRAR